MWSYVEGASFHTTANHTEGQKEKGKRKTEKRKEKRERSREKTYYSPSHLLLPSRPHCDWLDRNEDILNRYLCLSVWQIVEIIDLSWVHAFNTGTWEAGAGIYMSFRLAWAIK